MIEGYNIICFAPNDWWAGNPSCTTHIMQRLAQRNKVLFINPFSSDLGGGIRRGFLSRLVRKCKSVVKCLRQPEKNLYVYSPLFLPMQGNPIIDQINNYLLMVQLKLICHYLKMSDVILWMENVRAADMMRWFNSLLTVYHVSDLFSKCKYTANKAVLEKREAYITARSDLLICVSRLLFDMKSRHHNNVHYLPHGVDFECFRKAEEQSLMLDEIKDIPRPIAGYFGTMTNNNDIDMLVYCARQLPHVSFVFAGQITGGDYRELLSLPNVYHLGRLPYEKIPALNANFDVCMLQWKVTDWIRNCNPLKLFEYMASGKPIVSVEINEVVDNYANLVSVAYSKEEYCQAISNELALDSTERRKARIEAAARHGWDSHVEIISGLMEQTIRERYRMTESERPKCQ